MWTACHLMLQQQYARGHRQYPATAASPLEGTWRAPERAAWESSDALRCTPWQSVPAGYNPIYRSRSSSERQLPPERHPGSDRRPCSQEIEAWRVKTERQWFREKNDPMSNNNLGFKECTPMLVRIESPVPWTTLQITRKTKRWPTKKSAHP